MRFLTLLSGGIDSPVAAYLMMAKGHDVDLINFDGRPYSDEENIEKIRRLAKRLAELAEGSHRPRLFLAPHARVMELIKDKAPERYTCLLCRRMMFRLASVLAKREGIDALVTGESLGQVASQTSDNIKAQEPAASIPVLRPLIGLDKLEIIEVAQRIGTFELSTSKGEGCRMSPDRPATKARLEQLLDIETGLDPEDLVSQGMATIRELDPLDPPDPKPL